MGELGLPGMRPRPGHGKNSTAFIGFARMFNGAMLFVAVSMLMFGVGYFLGSTAFTQQPNGLLQPPGGRPLRGPASIPSAMPLNVTMADVPKATPAPTSEIDEMIRQAEEASDIIFKSQHKVQGRQQPSQQQQSQQQQQQTQTLPVLCSDTCSTARNGVCEDGRTAPVRDGVDIQCELGSDCADCGPWQGHTLPPMDGGMDAPLAFLKDAGATVRVSQTVTRPSMLMVHTSPTLDVDVSDLVERVALVEGGITQVFYEALHEDCVRPDGSRRLVLDIGANFGYFAVYSALLGCRVIAWEPVPMFRAFTRLNLALNNVSHLVELRGRVAGERDDEELDMHVPTIGIWGTASVGGINQHSFQRASKIVVRGERVDSVVDEDVLLFKADVEGYEAVVLRGAEGLLKKRKVENMVLEYNPGTAEWVYPSKDMLEDNPKMLMSILNKGYRIMQLDDNYGKAGDIDYENGIPPLPEVLAENLQYDLADVEMYKAGQLGCPKPPEIKEAVAQGMTFMNPWLQCNQMEDVHPKSLRSAFAQNTNVWAVHKDAKSASAAVRDRVVGVFDLAQDSRYTWESAKPPREMIGPMGMASRVCHYLMPDKLVRSRCDCSHALTGEHKNAAKHEECVREEKFVKELVEAGKMPFRDLGGR